MRDLDESVRFYKEHASASTCRSAPRSTTTSRWRPRPVRPAPASARAARGFPASSVPFTLIEFKNIERKSSPDARRIPARPCCSSPCATSALVKKLKAAGVPIVTTGGEPVQITPGLKIVHRPGSQQPAARARRARAGTRRRDHRADRDYPRALVGRHQGRHRRAARPSSSRPPGTRSRWSSTWPGAERRASRAASPSMWRSSRRRSWTSSLRRPGSGPCRGRRWRASAWG